MNGIQLFEKRERNSKSVEEKARKKMENHEQHKAHSKVNDGGGTEKKRNIEWSKKKSKQLYLFELSKQ